MHYIVGLGNPGEKYKDTRHNVGFLIVEHFVTSQNLPAFVSTSKYSGVVSEGALFGEDVSVLKPDTYMNKSGSAVKKLVPKGHESELVVVYDDVDLPLGEIKISVGRGDGGHNGIKSIVASLGTKEFARVRVGVARTSFWTGKTVRPKGDKLSRHVLGQFGNKEAKVLADVKKRAVGALCTILEKGVKEAMNEYN